VYEGDPEKVAGIGNERKINQEESRIVVFILLFTAQKRNTVQEGIIDYYQFRREDEKWVFEDYGHYMVVILFIPILIGLGLATEYAIPFMAGGALLSYTLVFRQNTTFDFERGVVHQQWMALGKRVGAGKAIPIMPRMQLEAVEGKAPESVQYLLNVYDPDSNTFISLLTFQERQRAE
jgi:hypothetical protein